MVKNSLLRVALLFILIGVGIHANTLSDYVKELNAAKNKAQVEKTFEQIKSLYLNAIVDNDETLRKAAQKVLDEKSNYLARFDTPDTPKRSKSSTVSTYYLKSVTEDPIKVTLQFSHTLPKNHAKFLHIHDKKKGFRKNIYDIKNAAVVKNVSGKLQNGVRYKVAQFDKETVRIVFYTKDKFYTSSRYNGTELSIRTKVPSRPIHTAKTTRPAPQPSGATVSSSSLPRVMRSEKVVVVDPGHGGKDCGTRSSKGVCEKKVVLIISKHVARELNKMGYTTYLTRATDKFVNLRSRTRMANKKNADVFVSIHANAIKNKKARLRLKGVETYFLSRARTSRAKRVAAIENQEELEDLDYFSKNTFLNVLNGQRIVASNKLAIDIQKGMLGELKKKYSGLRDGGVREGPFWVLVGAQMPSVLVETGYMSHPVESERLNNPYYQKIIAQGIAKGIDSYFSKNL